MRARISKNLKGSIILNSIGPGAMVASREFSMTEEQYWAPDIQLAIGKHLVILLDDAPPAATLHKVTNLGFSSISLPKVGVLRGGRSVDVHSDVLKMDEYKALRDAGCIAIDLNLETGGIAAISRETATIEREKEAEKPKVKRGRPRKEVTVASDKPVTLKPDSDPTNERAKPIFLKPTSDGVEPQQGKLQSRPGGRGMTKTASEESVVIEGKEDDSPNFVDEEHDLERIKNHPILSKKKIDLDKDEDVSFIDAGQVKDDGVEFISDQETIERIRNHPILRNKKR